MDKRLKNIELLYGEQNEDSGVWLKDIEPDQREEYEALKRIKSKLDGRAKQKPEASTLEAVLRSAERAGSMPRRTGDRDAIPSGRQQKNRVKLWTGTLTAIVLMTSLAWWVVPEFRSPHADNIVEERDAGIPSWDDSDDLRSIYWRIEALKESNEGLAWDEPGVPLEMVPLNGEPSVPYRQEAGIER